MMMKLLLLVLASAALVQCQRPPYAGTRPIGYPLVTTPATTPGLEDRFGEEDGTTTTQRLPIEANGDKDLVDRLSKLPIDKQPFWFINWQALEAHRQKPQTYPQKPNPFIDTGSSNFGNVGVPNSGNVGVLNSGNVGVPNSGKVGVPNSGNVGVPNSGNVGVSNAGSVGNRNSGEVLVPFSSGNTGLRDPSSGNLGNSNTGSGSLNSGVAVPSSNTNIPSATTNKNSASVSPNLNSANSNTASSNSDDNIAAIDNRFGGGIELNRYV